VIEFATAGCCLDSSCYTLLVVGHVAVPVVGRLVNLRETSQKVNKCATNLTGSGNPEDESAYAEARACPVGAAHRCTPQQTLRAETASCGPVSIRSTR
jgi:hypothetical protein